MQLEKRHAELTAAGLTVVPISVDSPEQNRALAKRLTLSKLALYSDTKPKGSAAQAWQVWDADTEIALAATFIVAKDGKVIYRYVGANKADRPSVDQLLRATK